MAACANRRLFLLKSLIISYFVYPSTLLRVGLTILIPFFFIQFLIFKIKVVRFLLYFQVMFFIFFYFYKNALRSICKMD